MTYVGDFPPCSHRYINSGGMVICQLCGQPAPARRGLLGATASNG